MLSAIGVDTNIVIVIFIVIILGVKAPLDLFYAINICFIYTTSGCFIYKVLSSTNIYFYIHWHLVVWMKHH